ncbi:hypothetical protein CRE_06361 [Caenorhabditis remanei]|uniref:Uncharacterized protein n=1 Tax=Caenorhabditis remanei TaxID=31234 RepID=E3M1Q1_CAERE|nr:hypothetical protein CRE_06361 [Caenorhabditis remanei]
MRLLFPLLFIFLFSTISSQPTSAQPDRNQSMKDAREWLKFQMDWFTYMLQSGDREGMKQYYFFINPNDKAEVNALFDEFSNHTLESKEAWYLSRYRIDGYVEKVLPREGNTVGLYYDAVMLKNAWSPTDWKLALKSTGVYHTKTD